MRKFAFLAVWRNKLQLTTPARSVLRCGIGKTRAASVNVAQARLSTAPFAKPKEIRSIARFRTLVGQVTIVSTPVLEIILTSPKTTQKCVFLFAERTRGL